jgi:hypothetical protein
MPQKEITVTRRIQLLIDSDDKSERERVWTALYQWRFICYKAANYIFSHQYIQDNVKEIFYLNDDTKVKLCDIKRDSDGILTTSRVNTTYQVLSRKFKGELPMNILAALNNLLVTQYNLERTQYQNGERSLRNYKKTIPIPIPPRNITRIRLSEKGNFYSFTIFGLSFNTYFGKDYDDKPMMWERFMKGEYKLGTSSIVFEDGKIYLLAVFKYEKTSGEIRSAIIAEAELSIEIPIVVRIGNARYEIGNKEEFLYRRLAIQKSRIRAQRSVKYNRSSNGTKRKKQNLLSFADKERRYIESKLHLYSRMLINLCIKYGVGNLILVNQEAKEIAAKNDNFLLKNWGYFGLKELVRYKANIAGINFLVE